MSGNLAKVLSALQNDGPVLNLTCSATGDWTDGKGNSVGTSATSGIYKMKPGDHSISAISAASDAAAIIDLPDIAEAAGQFYFIEAPTGASGGDISVRQKGTATEISTYGDLDADDEHVLFYSTGTRWLMIFDGVA